MRVIICGSRTWTDTKTIRTTINNLKAIHGESLVIVHGDCPTGADKIAGLVCQELAIAEEKYPADWDRYGRRAGFIRNREMALSDIDHVHAFDLGTRGTALMMSIANDMQIPVTCISGGE